MSVPLKQSAKSEASLVLFTLCVPTSVGTAFFGLVFGGGLQPAFAACACASAGMAGSIAHLAKPWRAPLSLRNVRSSWLSREIAAVSLFWVFLVAWMIGEWLRLDLLSLVGRACATTSGAVLLTVVARAYQVSTRPAWRERECLIELASCALGAGSALFAASTNCPIGTLWTPGIVASAVGFALDVVSHKSRRTGLESLGKESDERIPLTLKRYDDLQGKIRAAWIVEAAAVAMAVTGLWWPAVALQLIAHGSQRSVFYALPVQVRYVARLRK